MEESEEAATEVDRTKETATAKVKACYITGIFITLDAIPGATVAALTLRFP